MFLFYIANYKKDIRRPLGFRKLRYSKKVKILQVALVLRVAS